MLLIALGLLTGLTTAQTPPNPPAARPVAIITCTRFGTPTEGEWAPLRFRYDPASRSLLYFSPVPQRYVSGDNVEVVISSDSFVRRVTFDADSSTTHIIDRIDGGFRQISRFKTRTVNTDLQGRCTAVDEATGEALRRF